MKKILAAVLVSALIGLGLVATTGTATAACPYQGCTPTNTKLNAPSKVQKGSKITAKVKVNTAGNGTAKGSVKLIIKRKKGGYYFSKTVKYTGSKVFITSGKLKKKGGYTITAKFKPKDGSNFSPSSASSTFKVKKK